MQIHLQKHLLLSYQILVLGQVLLEYGTQLQLHINQFLYSTLQMIWQSFILWKISYKDMFRHIIYLPIYKTLIMHLCIQMFLVVGR
ncbi:MAG: hypothetical protein CL489_17425 [Acidobacteria bacterium]|nr:hypothetical protein [Acidobacteriota bacterium]